MDMSSRCGQRSLRRLDDQHWTTGGKDEVLGDAAQERLADRASATTTDHQQIRARLVREGQDGVRGVVGPVRGSCELEIPMIR